MKTILTKAGKTFLQAAIAYVLTLNLTGINYNDKNVMAGIILSACAAGLSALMNVDWTGIETKTKPEKNTDKTN